MFRINVALRPFYLSLNKPVIDTGCQRNCVTVFGQNSQVCGAMIFIRVEAGIIRHVVVCSVVFNFFMQVVAQLLSYHLLRNLKRK